MLRFACVVALAAAVTCCGGCQSYVDHLWTSTTGEPTKGQKELQAQKQRRWEAERAQEDAEWERRDAVRRQEAKDAIAASRAALAAYRAGEPDGQARCVQTLLELQERTYLANRLDRYPEAAWLKEAHPELAFAVAAEAQRRGNAELAEAVYQDLIGFYRGLAYEGIRDRAMAGLADLRAAQ